MNSRIIADFDSSMQRKIASLPQKIRPLTRESGQLPRAILLTGARGVGKTTFLLYHSAQSHLLYISADNPLIANESLYEASKAIFMEGYEGIIIDEVHYARDWSQHIKALYDDFPEHKIWISDSSTLVLRQALSDTSRRFVPIKLPLLSFREFLFLETGAEYPPCDAFTPDLQLPLKPVPDILKAFKTYRASGTRPFYKEGMFAERMQAVLDKSLYGDVPFFLPGITDGNLRLMKAIAGTLSQSAIPRLHVRSLCADWGIGAEKLYHILSVMESVGILRIVRTEHDTKAKSAGDKLFFSDPAFYSVLNGNPGTEREALLSAMCAESGWNVETTRDESAGDFVITNIRPRAMRRIVLEVGGSSKKSKKADYVIRDDIDYPSQNALPLWLLGMGW